jgi:lipopolysaccharide export system permease protein
VPQFLSSAVILTAVLVVSQLARLTEVLAAFGLSLENIFLPFLYIVLPFMSFNIPIAYLFAVMISFGRLSADGEWAALLASGYSLARAAIPVMIIAGFLYGLGLLCSMHLEAWGRREIGRAHV